MRELLEQSIRRLSEGQSVVWCVILASSGSTPRGPGAKMAVFADGTTAGTVGGGAVEFQAVEFAKTLREGTAVTRDYDLYSGGSADVGMVCGGHVRIGYFSLEPDSAALLQALLMSQEGNAPSKRRTCLELGMESNRASIKLLGEPDLHSEAAPLPAVPTLLEQDCGFRYVEPIGRDYRVYIFGAGHVSAALVPVLLPLGFPMTVVYPRPELADAARFPGAAVLCADFEPLPASVNITDRDYVVVMTPGHEKDLAVLRQVLRTPAGYIGCIGSRKKTAFVNQALREAGFSEEALSRIHAPIGLPIGARTPEEIAISIAAELILHRAEHS